MTNAAADTLTPTRGAKAEGSQEKPATRTRRARTSAGEESDRGARFFLGKANDADGTPDLDREIPNEGEALVEALRLGVTFYAVQEFRVVPDFSGRKPQLNKEAVEHR